MNYGQVSVVDGEFILKQCKVKNQDSFCSECYTYLDTNYPSSWPNEHYWTIADTVKAAKSKNKKKEI